MHKHYFKISASRVRYRRKRPTRRVNTLFKENFPEGFISSEGALIYSKNELQDKLRTVLGESDLAAPASLNPAFLYVPSLPGPLVTEIETTYVSIQDSRWFIYMVLFIGGFNISIGFIGHTPIYLHILSLTAGTFSTAWGARMLYKARKKISKKLAPSPSRALDNSTDLIRSLGQHYNQIYNYSLQKDNYFAIEALNASHMALIEVCDLLGNKPPVTPEEIAYVQNRVDALKKMEVTLQENKERVVLEARSEEQQARDAESLIRKESIEAIVDFEDRTQIGSLARINSIVESNVISQLPAPNK